MDTVTTTFITDYKTKYSKFFGYLAPCRDLEELEKTLESIRSEHLTATHHCYAYRINPANIVEFSTDDGEPGGTAGVPILNVLRSRGLVNICCIVVRYYGGTNLGKSGLKSAYSHTADLTADASIMKQIVPVDCYRVVYNYEHQSVINSIKHAFDLIELNSVYLERVSLTFAIPNKQVDIFKKQIRASVHLFDEFESLGQSYHILK